MTRGSGRGPAGLSPREEALRPLYSRVLRLHHLDPGGLLCFTFFEGTVTLALLLALAELINWWGVPLLPVLVAFLVKVNDLVAGVTVRSAGRVPQVERERLRRELGPAVGRARVPVDGGRSTLRIAVGAPPVVSRPSSRRNRTRFGSDRAALPVSFRRAPAAAVLGRLGGFSWLMSRSRVGWPDPRRRGGWPSGWSTPVRRVAPVGQWSLPGVARPYPAADPYRDVPVPAGEPPVRATTEWDEWWARRVGSETESGRTPAGAVPPTGNWRHFEPRGTGARNLRWPLRMPSFDPARHRERQSARRRYR